MTPLEQLAVGATVAMVLVALCAFLAGHFAGYAAAKADLLNGVALGPTPCDVASLAETRRAYGRIARRAR